LSPTLSPTSKTVKKGNKMKKCPYCKKEIKPRSGRGRPFSKACQDPACQALRRAKNLRQCVLRKIQYERLQHEMKI
jgi:hypothetical protein